MNGDGDQGPPITGIPIWDGVVVAPVGHQGEIEHLIERARDKVTIRTGDEMVSLLGGPVEQLLMILVSTFIFIVSVCLSSTGGIVSPWKWRKVVLNPLFIKALLKTYSFTCEYSKQVPSQYCSSFNFTSVIMF